MICRLCTKDNFQIAVAWYSCYISDVSLHYRCIHSRKLVQTFILENPPCVLGPTLCLKSAHCWLAALDLLIWCLERLVYMKLESPEDKLICSEHVTVIYLCCVVYDNFFPWDCYCYCMGDRHQHCVIHVLHSSMNFFNTHCFTQRPVFL